MKTPLIATLLVASLSTYAFAARADDDPSAIAAARTTGIEGLKLAEAGNCKDAVEKLDRAEKLHHAPTTLTKLGECNVQLGRLVLGAEQLRRQTRETLAADAPPAFVQAKARAQKLLDETLPRIAQLHVDLAPAGISPQVSIDGEVVPAAMLDIDRPTDPGSHVVEATAKGYKPASQTISLKDGERLTIRLTLDPDPNAVAPVVAPVPIVPPAETKPAPAPPPEAPAEPPRRSSTLRVVGWSLVGVGAAGLVTGIVAGSLALGSKSSLNDACDANKSCDPGQRDTLDGLKTEATVSTIGFIVGGVGLAGGAAILLFGPKERATSARATSPLRGFDVGLGTASFRGTF